MKFHPLKIVYQDFINWSKVEYCWLVICLFSVLIGSLHSSLIEITTGVTNVICVLLIAKGRISNFYWGLVGVISFAFVAYQQGFYGSMLLHLIYIFLQVFGLYSWMTSEHNSIDVKVKQLSFNGIVITITAICLTTILSYNYLINTSDPKPLLDTFTLTFSLAAIVLMIFRYREQWLLWIMVNYINLLLWIELNGSHGAMIVMLSIFFINSLFGYYKWYFVKENK